jgi:hypothetical protein
MESVARVLLSIGAFAFAYPLLFFGLLLFLLVGYLVVLRILVVRSRNNQEQVRQAQDRLPRDYRVDTVAFSEGGHDWAWLALGTMAALGLWMTWLFLPGWLIPGTPAASLVLNAQNRLGYWLIRLAPIAAVVFFIRECEQYRRAGLLEGWMKRLVSTAGMGLAVHVLLCLGSIVLALTPIVRFVLPAPGRGGHNYGALFEPLVSTMVWPFYMWLLLVPLSVAITAGLRAMTWARRSWSGPAGNLVVAATLGLLLPIWLVTGSFAKGVNSRGERGLTALMAAAGTGHLRGVRGLIGAGADVNARSQSYALYNGTTALQLALGHPEIVLALLESGARPGSYELLSAVQDKNDTLVEALLRAGADVHTRGPQERTVLMLAAEESRSDSGVAGIVRRLIAAGADVNARDNSGQTALMMGGSEEVNRALLEAGADPTLKDRQGNTALLRYGLGDPSAALIRRAMERTNTRTQ